MSLKIALLISWKMITIWSRVIDSHSWPSSRNDAESSTCAGDEDPHAEAADEDVVGLLQVELQIQRSHGAEGLNTMPPRTHTPLIESGGDRSFLATATEHNRSADHLVDLAHDQNISDEPSDNNNSWLLVGLGLAFGLLWILWVLSKGTGDGIEHNTDGAALSKEKLHDFSFWWKEQATPQFKFAVTYSGRVASWTVLMSVVPLCVQKGREFFADNGFNVAYIVCNFLFIVGPNVGSTVQTSIYGLFGNFWAGLMLYVLNGFFPGGYTGDNPEAFWIGLICSMIFILSFMCLNVNGSVQFFALYNWIPYGMTYLNPNDQNNVSKAFTLNYKGAAVNAIMLYFLGVFFAILCTLLPWPETARQKAIQQVRSTLEETLDLLRQILQYYSGKSSTMQVYELMNNVQGIRRRVDEANNAISASWYECFGFGSAAKSCVHMKRFVETLQTMVRHLDPLIGVICREGFEGAHVQFFEQIHTELFSCVDNIEKLSTFSLESSIDGVLSANERAVLETDLAKIQSISQALEDKFEKVYRAMSKDQIKLDLTGENYAVYMTLEIANHVKECSQALLAEDQPEESIVTALKDNVKGVWDPNVVYSESHIKWVFRNTLSLTLCFWLGYFGWSPGCSQPGKSCFIEPYNSGLATLVIVLLSKFVGSTFKNALDRLTAVVLANVIGQLGYVLVGWCTPMGRFWTGIFVFVVVMPNMYVAYAGGSYAALGMRLAAIGAMSLLVPCSDSYISAQDYADQYHAISDIVIGAGIVMMVDMTFGDQSASVLAKKSLIKAIHDYQQIFKDFKSDKPPSPKELIDRLGKMQDELDNVGSLAQDAAKEPRFWRQPWRPSLYQEAATGFTRLAMLLRHIIPLTLGANVESKDFHAFLNSLRSWPKILSEVESCLGETVDLSKYILHMNRHEEVVGLTKMLSQSKDTDSLSMDALVTEINEKRGTKMSTSRHTLNTRLSVEMETLISLTHHMNRIQHQIVLQKNH